MRKAKKETRTGPAMCEWNDHGLTCGHVGILSPGTAGGPWFCREHFYKLRGYHDADNFRGNEEIIKTPLHSFAVDEMQKELVEFKAKQTKREPGEEG